MSHRDSSFLSGKGIGPAYPFRQAEEWRCDMNKKMTFLAVFLASIALMGTGCATGGYYGYSTAAVSPARTYTTGTSYVAPTYVETVQPVSYVETIQSITYIETVQPVGYVGTRYVAPSPRHHRGGHHRPPPRAVPSPRMDRNGDFTSRPIGSRPTRARPAARPTGAPVRQLTRPGAKSANVPARQPTRPATRPTRTPARRARP